MPPEPEMTSPPTRADYFFVQPGPVDWQNRLPDGGPRYAETPANPYAPDAAAVAEPWNSVTAALFIGIVLWWAWKLWGRFAKYPFVTCCLPILLAGGIGSTLYHATRTQMAYFLLDVIPISLIGIGGSVYLTIRLGKSVGLKKVLVVSVGLLVVYLVLNGVLFRFIQSDNRNLRVNLSYASLAALIVIPMVVVLIHTRFRHAVYVGAGMGCFAIAWFCRLIDSTGMSDLPMGTHWLWHTFGALTTHVVAAYFYRIEGEEIH